MAERIYDQTMGQLAGVEVTTTGNSTPTRDGTEAYAQMTVSASGQPISSVEGAGNLVDLSGASVTAGSLSFNANAQYAIIDTQGFEAVSFTFTGFGTATLAVQWSNLSTSGFIAGDVTNINSGVSAATVTASGQYTASASGRYMKVLVTAYTTGPIVVTPVLNAGSGAGAGAGTVSAQIEAVATAAAPAYVEGTSNQVSQDLHGALRFLPQTPTGTAIDLSDPATVQGVTAADSALTVAPVTGGGLAKTANPTAVADGDVVNTLHDKLGKLVAVSAIRDLKGVQHTTITASTSETTVITAVASTFLDVYGMIFANSSATATEATIKDATAGTTRATVAIPANASAGFMLDAGSAIPQAAVNNNWTVTLADSVTSVFVTALYVKNT